MKNIQTSILSWLHIQYLIIKQHSMLSVYSLVEDLLPGFSVLFDPKNQRVQKISVNTHKSLMLGFFHL